MQAQKLSVPTSSSAAYFAASTAGAKEGVAQGGAQPKLRDDTAPGPLTQASAPPGVPAKSQISWGGMAPGRLGREDARSFGDGTLNSAIDSIRLRFGSQALTRATELPPPQPWPSGTPIDQLTGINGLPHGRLSLFIGGWTSGKLSLALAVLAKATQEFAHAAVIDQGGFDPWTLLPFSPELSALTVVSAQALEVAGEAAASLAKAGAGFLLVMGSIPEHWLGPLESGAFRSGTVVVVVIDAPDRALTHASSFSLGFSRAHWVHDRGQLIGLRTSVRCLKNRIAPPLGEIELEIRYPVVGNPAGLIEVTSMSQEDSPRISAAV